MINKKNILKYLAEGLLIIFSISIAFSLENWRQSKASEKRQNAILKEIKNEMLIDVVLLETLIENSKNLKLSLSNATRIIDNNDTHKFDSLIFYLYEIEGAYTSSSSIRDNPDLMLQAIEHIKRDDISVPLRSYYKFYRGKLSHLVENFQHKRYELLSQFLNENHDRSIEIFENKTEKSNKKAAINKSKFFEIQLLNKLSYLGSQSIYVPWIEDGKSRAKKIADSIKIDK